VNVAPVLRAQVQAVRVVYATSYSAGEAETDTPGVVRVRYVAT